MGDRAGRQVDIARDRIRAAFAEVAHPGPGRVEHCGRCSHEADVQQLEFTSSWEAIPEYVLQGMSLAFFSPEGFRFALPALMLHALRVWDSSDQAVDFAVWGLGPPDLWDSEVPESEREWWDRKASAESVAEWHAKIRILDADQRGAVASFLEALAEVADSDEILREDARKALAWWTGPESCEGSE